MTDLLMVVSDNPTLNGDIAVVNNDIPLVDGIDEVRQLIQQALRTFQGEYFLDVTIGVPYYQEIMLKGAQMGVVAGILKSAILAVEGVINLVDFSLNFDPATRQLTVQFTAQTENGPIDVLEVV